MPTGLRRLQISVLLLVTQIPVFPVQPPTDPRNVNPVEVGSTLPEISLKTKHGRPVSLTEALGGQKAVIIFYRGSWCPYCTRHLASIGAHEQAILEQGYKIIAISPDKPSTLRDHINEAELNYSLYSDSNMTAATAFGLSFRVDAATLKKLESYEIDIKKASGQSHQMLPVPAVFISDSEGRITFRYFNPDYSKRLSSEAILKAIQ